MEQQSDTLIRDLIDAFYNSADPDTFLAGAGAALGVRFSLILPGSTIATSDTTGHNSIEIITDGKYIAALTIEGYNNAYAKNILKPVSSLLIKGVTLYNWFPFAFRERPDEFLRKCDANISGLFCLYIPAQMSKRANAEACARLSSIYNALHCFIESDGFTLLLKASHHDDFKFIGSLSDELTRCGFRAGLSGPFKNPGLALNCMEKAKEAALSHCGNDDAPVTHASKVRWSMFCKSASYGLLHSGFYVTDFLLYALKRILSYDAQNSTQYYESMYQYLLYGKNLKPASQALLIHRNTLAYRIGRIGELFDIDFEDRHVCFELLFSCKLYEEMVARI